MTSRLRRMGRTSPCSAGALAALAQPPPRSAYPPPPLRAHRVATFRGVAGDIIALMPLGNLLLSLSRDGWVTVRLGRFICGPAAHAQATNLHALVRPAPPGLVA